jgi:protein-arginine kinase activator protein McsA
MLIKAGGSLLFNAFSREQGFEKIVGKHPAEWARYEDVMRKIQYADLKELIEARNGIEYTNALRAQLRAIKNVA